jgi:hypothetical protein
LDVINRNLLARRAWEAARNGGFSTRREWRDHRRKGGLPSIVAELIADGVPLYEAGLEIEEYGEFS